MNELILKLFKAKRDFNNNFHGEPNILFLSLKMYNEIMVLPETTYNNFYQPIDRTLIGCEIVKIYRDDFEVLASSHDQMQLISERHVGTTDDIKLEKLMISRLEYKKAQEFYTPEYITIPFYILESYRKQFQPTQKQYARRGFTYRMD
ncbi:hypothetical protein IC766_14320 [Acinetobacter seifertii]|uniref:hypothetical protein n=1 Tax=Acinetobacter seifertii TaxID=1530123 RepID=UPI00168B4C66|nr:hypothetical protein [Acinetobacter seifertii]QNY13276.1 hypothetical protein IC766_14320 [Acinetobacter seifertii]